MSILRHLVAAASTAAFFFPAHAAELAAAQFERVAAGACRAGALLELDVDPESQPAVRVEEAGAGVMLRYPMAFNNIAEGWSWRPLADPATEDYYRFKFLPLQSVDIDKGGYDLEDKIGTPQRMSVQWRYDYFLAFENLYDFYQRTVDDDAGFSARVNGHPTRVGLRAVARLTEPCTSESTTFYKATYGRPVDFTLKKRYLVGVLEEIRFVDLDTGKLLASVKPNPQR